MRSNKTTKIAREGAVAGMRLSQAGKFGRVGLAGVVGALGILGLAMLFPSVNRVDAAEITDGASSGVAVKTLPALAITLEVPENENGSGINMEITPMAQGNSFQKQTSNLTVATNNYSGYGIYLYTSNGESTLAPLNPNVESAINAISTDGVTYSDFGGNTWGYSLSKDAVSDATTYSAVPVSGTTPVTTVGEARANDVYNLTFGAAVDLTLPSGDYKNSVVVSVVANAADLSISTIDTMQAMSTEVCENSFEGETKQLIDTRDSKTYYVAKLKDGNCWMTQNLDLDLTTTGLDSTSSDIGSAAYAADGTVKTWDANSQYAPTETITKTTIDTGDTSNYVNTWSWDQGTYVLKYPQKGASCGSVENISACSDFQKIDDSWTGDFTANADTGTYTAVDEANKKYDPHYLIGNYYMWNAAVAGTGGDADGNPIVSKTAEDSICPKGWGLPENGKYGTLLTQYGVNSSVSGTNYNIAGDPLHFVRSGGVSIDSGVLYNAGVGGFYWSSTATSSASTAYGLYFNASDVYPSGYNSRWVGRSLRCVAD